MSGWAGLRIQKTVGLIVCTLLCTALLASPGAWAQKGGQIDSSSQIQQNPNPGTEEAPSNQSAVDQRGTCLDDTHSAPESDISLSGDKEAEVNQKQGASDNSSAPSAKPGYGFVFQASISIGGKQVPCSYWVNNEEGTSVAIGTRTTTTPPGAEWVYYVPALIDDNLPTSGPLVIPQSVTYQDKTGASYTYNVTTVGDCAFHNCTKITTTGLKGNTFITSLEHACYDACSGLTTTGLEDNHAVTKLGAGIFQSCSNVDFKTTGLSTNDTLTYIPIGMFQYCKHLTSTGLAENKRITEVGRSSFKEDDSLLFTGLETNSTVTTIKSSSFRLDPLLTSTGLDTNKTVQVIDESAFRGCTKLGTEATATANAGDLVLNGGGGTLSVGNNAFLGTHYERVYLGSELENPTFEIGALDTVEGTKIPSLYVHDLPAWQSRTSFTFDSTTYATSDGSLVMMNNPVSSMSAQRVQNTSDQAQISFSSTRPFWVGLADDKGHSLGTYEVTKKEDSYTLTNDAGLGLSPDQATLSAQVFSSESQAGFVYPQSAHVQTYNTTETYTLSCPLSPITYTVVFKSNAVAQGTMEAQSFSYNEQKPLSANRFTSNLMHFGGWSKDAQNERRDYSDQQSVCNLAAKENEEVCLYALWDIGLIVKSEQTLEDPLKNMQYTLSYSKGDAKDEVGGLKEQPDQPKDIVWPLTSNEGGLISMYGLSKGTYFLHNVKVSAGFNAKEPTTIEVGFENGEVTLKAEGVPASIKDQAAQISIAFSKTPSLPSTGNLSAGLVQGAGALGAIVLIIVLVRRIRRKRAV